MFWHKHWDYTWKRAETVQDENKPLYSQNSTGRKQAEKTSQMKPKTYSCGKGETQKTQPRNTENNSQRIGLIKELAKYVPLHITAATNQ